MAWLALVLIAADGAWLDVPFVAQSGAGCGAASIAMVMQYWIRQTPGLDSRDADGDRIYRLLSPWRGTISGVALKEYVEARGFRAFIFDGEVRDLRENVEKGRPVVVCLAPREKRGPLHYAVVAGLDGAEIALNDPVRGRLFREPLERFEREWTATRHWTLLAVPKP